MATQGAYKRIDDGLVLHFDTANIKCFRGEPTVNLKPYPILSHWINSGTCTINQTETDILPPFINNQLHIWSCVVNTTGSIHFGMQPTTILPSTTYTISIWYRQNKAGVSSPYIRTNVNNDSIGSFTYNGSSNSNSWPINTWIRITATATTPSNENGIYLSNYVGSQVGDKIWYYGYQIEQKDHVTAYTPTSRGTTVATGGGLIDLSNNQNHGELVNAVSYNSDNCGSWSFDGVDDYVTVPHNTNQVSINFSICTWIKSTFNNSSLQQLIITKANLFGTEYGWIIRKGKAYTTSNINDNKYYFSTYKNNHARYDATTYSDIEYTDNMWHHVVGVFNGGYYQNIYIDGIKQFASGTAYNDIGMLTTPMPINIQGYGDAPVNYNGTYYSTFQGSISHVLYYNRALSQSEITQIYNSTKSRYL